MSTNYSPLDELENKNTPKINPNNKGGWQEYKGITAPH
jgi:hypothetical protein